MHIPDYIRANILWSRVDFFAYLSNYPTNLKSGENCDVKAGSVGFVHKPLINSLVILPCL